MQPLGNENPSNYLGIPVVPTKAGTSLQVGATNQQPQIPCIPQLSQAAIPLHGPHMGLPAAASSGYLGSVPPMTLQSKPINNMPSSAGPSVYMPGSSQLHPTIHQSSDAFPQPSCRQYSGSQLGPLPPPEAVSTPQVPPSLLHQPVQGRVTPLTGSTTPLFSRDQVLYPNIGHSIEDFESLAVGSAPGSLDPGVDMKVLPRPLDSGVEPMAVPVSYPQNCHPRFFRLTTYAMPTSQSLQSRWHLPLGAVVHPLAELPEGEEVPVVNNGSTGVVRCRRCRAYINLYSTFTDAGRKWHCNLCTMLNDVPGEYFCALDITGRRVDVNHRPELFKGTVEFVAPTDYMVRPPMPPSYFFLIDVSATSVQSGLLEIVTKNIKLCLNDLPGFPRTRIGFLTFDSTLHFYNLKPTLAQPQMIVLADLLDIYLPLPDDLLVNLVDSRCAVETLLDSLPSMFKGNVNPESALGPALKAAYLIMNPIGGKLLVFESTLPSIGVGRLRLRGDDARIYGSVKEHTLRIPEDPFYKLMAAEFTKSQISVDIFVFTENYSDVASLGSLAKYSGGQVYYYPSFHAVTHGEKLKHELTRDLTRETAWEAVMRVRCGKGMRFTAYHGHFMLKFSDLIVLPTVDSDKAFAMQMSLEETLITSRSVYFQVALLYTTSSGERRIRVHTAAVPVVSDLAEMYQKADCGAVVSLMSRIACETSLSTKLEDARQLMLLKLVKSLKEYRNMYAAQHRLSGRLIYPESLRYLPLYILALCKSAAFRGGYADVPLDERCAAGLTIMILSVRRLLRFLYPALCRIDEMLMKDSDNFDELRKQLPLTVRCLDTRGIYILDNGFTFTMWFGRMLSPELSNSIFGEHLSSFPNLSKFHFQELDNAISKRLQRMIEFLRAEDTFGHQTIRVVRQGEQPRENFMFLSNLIEDKVAGIGNYVDWILKIHRQTQST